MSGLMKHDLLWIVEELGSIGGVEYMTTVYASELARAGHRVRLLAPRNALSCWTSRLEQSGVQLIRSPANLYDKRDLSEHARVICETDPPTLIQFLPLGDACVAWCKDRDTRTAAIAWEPTDLSDRCWWLPSNASNWVHGLDALIVLTDSAVLEARRRLDYPGHIATIPNAVFPAPLTVRPQPKKTPVVTCISRLSSEKAVEFAIAAFSLYRQRQPDARLHIWRDGPEKERLVLLTRMLGVGDHVSFCGTYEPIEGIDAVAESTTVCLLASLFEGMPIALIETALRGVPIVASRTVGAEAVLGADYPWLSPIGDTRSIADHLVALTENSQERARVRSFDEEDPGLSSITNPFHGSLIATTASIARRGKKHIVITQSVERARDILLVSPHADDVAYSLGGHLITGALPGKHCVLVTVFSVSDFAPYLLPPSGDSRVVSQVRADEDRRFAMSHDLQLIRLDHQEAPIRDNIRHVNDLFKNHLEIIGHPYLPQVRATIGGLLQLKRWSKVFGPLGLGGHIDHLLVRETLDSLFRKGSRFFFYEDLPYAGEIAVEDYHSELPLLTAGMASTSLPPSDWLDLKLKCLKFYGSQVADKDLCSVIEATDRANGERVWTHGIASQTETFL